MNKEGNNMTTENKLMVLKNRLAIIQNKGKYTFGIIRKLERQIRNLEDN
jgi:hypothetical protein